MLRVPAGLQGSQKDKSGLPVNLPLRGDFDGNIMGPVLGWLVWWARSRAMFYVLPFSWLNCSKLLRLGIVTVRQQSPDGRFCAAVWWRDCFACMNQVGAWLAVGWNLQTTSDSA